MKQNKLDNDLNYENENKNNYSKKKNKKNNF